MTYAKIKKKILPGISNISNFVRNSNLTAKFATLTTEAQLKINQGKTVKFSEFDNTQTCSVL